MYFMLANGNTAYLGGKKMYIYKLNGIYTGKLLDLVGHVFLCLFFFFGRDAVKKIALIRVWPFVRTFKSV